MKGVELLVKPATADGWFSPDVNLGELERLMQASFATRGDEAVREYFLQGSGLCPHNIIFLIGGYDTTTSDKLVSATVATRDRVGDLGFWYADKVVVMPGKYRGNGLMPDMISGTETEAKSLGLEQGVWRTSDESLDTAYSKLSDVQTKIGKFLIYGRNFLEKNTSREIFPGALQKFYEAAVQIATKPETVRPISVSPVFRLEHVPMYA